MKTMMHYPAHMKPISFQPSVHSKRHTRVKLNPVLITQSHQQYIAHQAQAFDYFLKRQQSLWQNIVDLRSQPHAASQKPGPQFSRQALEELASGNISQHFGEWFKPLDQYERLIRMPEPPLLLADRVTGIDAEPGSMKTGTIWTETDVTENAWYLHHGRMPAGIMIESGQADLLLASWLGFDLNNQGERVYRLLGCELSYHGELPQPGDTLCYDIHIDGQAKQGDIRLFFFHYDCRINGELRLKVRHGQAGFFSDRELAESEGVLWDASSEKCDTSSPLDLPRVKLNQSHFNQEQLKHFYTGNMYHCFGKGFELTQPHTRTPQISSDKMFFLHQITHFDTQGGPWQRGYLRAIQNIHPDDWFFKGHFKNDPCMPGTLMFEASLQAMAFYLTGLGYTLNKDGWRFEPMTESIYKMRCRGQVRPHSKQVVYEIFVSSVVEKPIPTLFADLLATVDGLKAFHTKIGLRLVPDWPLTPTTYALLKQTQNKPVASANGFQFDYASLLACAIGKPSAAFGDIYKVFDNHRKVARLPGPPYHFMSRVTHLQGQMGKLEVGAEMICEYDIPEDAWYFTQSQSSIPLCVFLEAALQPCGWLASYMGSTLVTKEDLVFRNLDGTGTLIREILPQDKLLRTHVKCTNISRTGGMIIESFQVQSFVGEDKVYEMNTIFGFFPLSAFENQAGLPVPEIESDILNRDSNIDIDLLNKTSDYFSEKLALPSNQLLMMDRVTGFWPTSGKKGLGQLRAEKIVNPSEWFFKSHFFQDPVQPGSLGLEVMIQLVQFYMLLERGQIDKTRYRFEPLALGVPMTWKYRGQVVPSNQKINITIDIMEKGPDHVIANGSLWVDEKRIYEASNIGMRITPAVFANPMFFMG